MTVFEDSMLQLMSKQVTLLEELKVEQNRTARELATIRQLVNDVVQYARGAEREIPEFMRRFMNYMHDLHDIRYMYEEVGAEVPSHLLREQERCDDRFRQLLKDLLADGNAFDKVRRQMADDPENKFDHTRQLTFRKSP